MGRTHIQSKQHSPPDTPEEEIHQNNHDFEMNRNVYILGGCITIASIGYAIHLGWDVVEPSVLCQRLISQLTGSFICFQEWLAFPSKEANRMSPTAAQAAGGGSQNVPW